MNLKINFAYLLGVEVFLLHI